jgi:hypothetical protein
MAITCYARYVSLDVRGGAVQARPKRAKIAKQVSPSKVESKPPLQLRTDLDPVEKRAITLETDDQDEEVVRLETAANRFARPGEQQSHSTSKAERRRMRREARMAG